MNRIASVNYLYLFSDFVQNEFDIDLFALCEENGIVLPEHRSDFISSATFNDVCEIAVKRIADPMLGLKFGSTLTFTHHGPLGAAIVSSETLFQAFNLVGRFPETGSPFRLKAQAGSEWTRLDFFYPTYSSLLFQFHVQTGIASFIALLKDAVGYVDRKIIAKLPFPLPEDVEKYTEILPITLYFDESEYVTLIPNQYLEQPLPRYDQVSKEMFVALCEATQQKFQRRQCLSGHILDILDAYSSYPSIEQIANTLGLSERTLRSRLREENETYRGMIGTHRLRRAKELLVGSTDSIELIAEKLGYSGVPNFYRAFKREFQSTPVEYRNANSKNV
jgi:AraC-like DNA-binding protein